MNTKKAKKPSLFSHFKNQSSPPQKPVTGLLPKDLDPEKEIFESLGFIFTDSDNPLLYQATLPLGWTICKDEKKRICIKDEKERIRVQVRSNPSTLCLDLLTRYQITEFYDKKKESFVISILDWNKKKLFSTRGHCPERLRPEKGGWERTSEYCAIRDEYLEFVENNFPDWRDPTKYWD